ncbi:hypothetical protein [Klebsiella oxytoca]|uniref:hypothetical protein n=1 Tax=Klebsiella oxytoca TaxID=571 RepID=UPI0019E27462|nr:Uncharacterised protein [Klebsiella oxytoca]
MATSKLIQGDTLTETSNAADGFNPATEVSNYSYTSARVAKPVYNKYKPQPANRKSLVTTPTGLSMTDVCRAAMRKITAVAATI